MAKFLNIILSVHSIDVPNYHHHCHDSFLSKDGILHIHRCTHSPMLSNMLMEQVSGLTHVMMTISPIGMDTTVVVKCCHRLSTDFDSTEINWNN